MVTELKKAFDAAEEERERKFKAHEMTKDEVLLHLRAQREFEHRRRIQSGFNYFAMCWDSKPTPRRSTDVEACGDRARTFECTPSFALDFFELSNKSVPLYVLTSPRKHKNKVHDCLQQSLGCYLYDRWFRPFESDIDFNQFIAKMIVPMDLECLGTRPSAALVDDIADINHAVVEFLMSAKKKIIKSIKKSRARGTVKEYKPMVHEWYMREATAAPGRVQHHYSVPALFRSLGIVLCTEAWENTGPAEIGKTLVCIFLTGEENPDLSAPITFDSIEDKIQAVLQLGPRKTVQTTLDAAVDFVIGLERREASAAAAAAGNGSNPAGETNYPDPRFPEAYNRFFEGVKAWGPSSGWVDASSYEEWTGAGASIDLFCYATEEDARHTCCMIKRERKPGECECKSYGFGGCSLCISWESVTRWCASQGIAVEAEEEME